MAREGLILNGILTTVRNKCFHLISLKTSENQEVLVFSESIKWGHWPKMGLQKD